MMTIECPECKAEMPSDAKDCPECGHPMAPAPGDFKPDAPARRDPSPTKGPAPSKSKAGSSALVLLFVLIGCVAISTQLTIFVIRPIGAVPEGKTLIISRMDKTQFIDSADAMCERTQGGVSLLCRGTALASISQNATIYLRLPYLESLYLYSTGGKTYSK